jgi:hypothetical protein
MKITSFLFGLLLSCVLTAPVPAIARRLSKFSMKNGNHDKYYYYDESSGGGGGSQLDQHGAVDIDYNAGASDEYYYTSDGSMEYGYLEAKMLWSNGGTNGSPYQCKSITHDYWVQVQKIVFKTCDSTWPATSKWFQYSYDCKKGAEKFTVEQMDNCYDVEQCKQVGISAAASVVGLFCKAQNGLFRERTGGWIPVKCVQYAEVSCKYDAVETAQTFIEGGVCGHGTSGMDYLDEIHQLCQKELHKMVEAAQLPLV